MDEHNTFRLSNETNPEGSNKPFVFSISLPEHYEIIEELGHGGMGTVYKARHKQLGNYVAIKVINPELLEGKNETKENARKRFVNEARAVSQLNHENLIGLKDFGVTAEGAAYMVMDYVGGKTLDDLIQRGPLEHQSVLQIFKGICDGLGHAHSLGVVHRDIKSANIIISKDANGTETPKLLDFGIARITGDDGKTQGLTATGEIFGSPLYIAPEQSLSSKVDARADIYSLGCVLYECLTGKPPFKGDTAMHTVMMHLNSPIPSISQSGNKELPADLDIIINRCLQKEPADRYQSTKELKADIELVLAGKKLKKPAQVRTKRTKSAANSPKTALIISLGCLLLLLTLAAVRSGRLQSGHSKDINSLAYEKDTQEAFAAFQRGDYSTAIYMQQASIAIYQEEIETLAKKLEKKHRGRAFEEINRRYYQLLGLKADNLKNIGDCYAKMDGKEEAAINSYMKALAIYRNWTKAGMLNPFSESCYSSCIALLKKVGRDNEAQSLQNEFDECLKSKK